MPPPPTLPNVSIPPPDPGLVASLRGLDRDGRLLFAMRTLRMFGYGFLAVVLVLYLAAAGLDPLAIGLVLTLTLIGDTIISLWLTTNADRFGRRRVLVAGAVLMIVGGGRLRVHELGAAAHPRRRHRRRVTDGE